MDARLSSVHTALPGRVETYDADKQEADIKPLVRRLITDSDGNDIVESIPVIPDVPIVFPRGGGYHLTFPIKSGDHVLLVFNESSIDNFMGGSGAEVSPDNFNRFDLSDPVAYAGFYPEAKSLSDSDPDDMTLGKDDGVVIHIKDDGTINLGSKDPADHLSLASIVNSEFERIDAELASLKSLLDSHTHIGAVPGPPFLMTGTNLQTPGFSHGPTNDVKSDVVKSD